jgi:photosystem II stability/assembly factor-like uncharacterized protein
MIRFFVISVMTAVLAWGAEPFKPAFACKEDDLQWAGMTCGEHEPCPIYLEISTVYPVGAKLFVSGNIHSAQSTLYSILLETDDSGATWREPVERVRGSELDAVQFVDSKTGWISGQRVYPIAGDPFFLVTTDGGGSWRKSDVLSEGADGFIQSFWFDSAKTGTLTLDRGGASDEQMRYARYETMAGGTSWSVRETSDKPLAASPKIALEAPTWRVRGDSTRKVLLLEKNGDGGWKPVAALALELARCTEGAAPAP